MSGIEKLIAFLICVVSISLVTFIAIKLRWILLNIEYISAYVKEYILSILAVKEKEYNEYKEEITEEIMLTCAIHLNFIEKDEDAYKEYEKEKLKEFGNKLDKKLEDLNFRQYPGKVDEEYKKIVRTPLLAIYAKTIFGNVKSFDEFIDKEYFEFIKSNTEKNRRMINDTSKV